MSGMEICDTLVIGGGPAGTSAALALAERGRPVRLLDAGPGNEVGLPPEGAFLDLRRHDEMQWRWQLGARFEALAATGASSPKLRVPGYQDMFARYAQANRLRAEGFTLVGALAGGGLSNAWGCGVARFDASELGALAAVRPELDVSYERVAKRIGISGASPDPLAEYFGLDGVADAALALDPLHARLWERQLESGAARDGFALGRARVAVLGEARDGRRPCDLRGMCLWGCRNGATWSAAFDLERLARLPDARVERLALVSGLRRDGDAWCAVGEREGRPAEWRARRILLAAGTVASTRLALGAMPSPPAVRLLSNPMAAFLLLQPAMLGRRHARGFGLAQLSYVLEAASAEGPAFGNLFSTAGLPMSEFLRYLPVGRRAGLPLLRSLLPAAMVGNVFLPGALSRHEAALDRDGELVIRGGADPALAGVHALAARRLSRAFRRLGAWMLPGSYVAGAPGADLHYAGTLPVSSAPRAHECGLDGELAGLPGIHVVDGAALPVLPAKAHTLTILANADRVGRLLAARDAAG
jgi:choline dehydrogenase-like flavoprotein